LFKIDIIEIEVIKHVDQVALNAAKCTLFYFVEHNVTIDNMIVIETVTHTSSITNDMLSINLPV